MNYFSGFQSQWNLFISVLNIFRPVSEIGARNVKQMKTKFGFLQSSANESGWKSNFVSGIYSNFSMNILKKKHFIKEQKGNDQLKSVMAFDVSYGM